MCRSDLKSTARHDMDAGPQVYGDIHSATAADRRLNMLRHCRQGGLQVAACWRWIDEDVDDLAVQLARALYRRSGIAVSAVFVPLRLGGSECKQQRQTTRNQTTHMRPHGKEGARGEGGIPRRCTPAVNCQQGQATTRMTRRGEIDRAGGAAVLFFSPSVRDQIFINKINGLPCSPVKVSRPRRGPQQKGCRQQI